MVAAMGDDEAVLAELLRALADPVRLAVVDELGRGPRPAGELADVAGVSAPTMSKHLRTLLRAGVVTDERRADDARVRVFRLRGPGAGRVGRAARRVRAARGGPTRGRGGRWPAPDVTRR